MSYLQSLPFLSHFKIMRIASPILIYYIEHSFLSITPLTLVHISLWSADKSSCMNRYPCYIYLHAVYRKVQPSNLMYLDHCFNIFSFWDVLPFHRMSCLHRQCILQVITDKWHSCNLAAIHQNWNVNELCRNGCCNIVVFVSSCNVIVAAKLQQN